MVNLSHYKVPTSNFPLKKFEVWSHIIIVELYSENRPNLITSLLTLYIENLY